MSVQEDTIVKDKVKFKRPSKWNVVLHNDDVTPMDYVVSVLQEIFHHNDIAAMSIMLQVHLEGKGVAGTYVKEIAETKITQVTRANAVMGFALKVSLEEV